MLFADGPTHSRLRGSVRDVFTRAFIARLGAGVEAIATSVITEPASGEPFDFMSQIALPLPIAVIGEWLNVEPPTAELLRELSPAIIRTLGTFAGTAELAAGAAASAALMTEFLPMAADRRAHPGEDLLSFIAADRDLALEEVAMTAILIAVAGHETTANLLGAGPDSPAQPAARRRATRGFGRLGRPGAADRAAAARRARPSHGAHRHRRSPPRWRRYSLR